RTPQETRTIRQSSPENCQVLVWLQDSTTDLSICEHLRTNLSSVFNLVYANYSENTWLRRDLLSSIHQSSSLLLRKADPTFSRLPTLTKRLTWPSPRSCISRC